MDTARHPLGLLAAITLTILVAVGALLMGAFLVAIAAGAVPILSSPNLAAVAVVGAAAAAYGALAVIAATGLWLLRAWAWPLAAAVHAIALTGVLIAATTGGPGVHITAGIALSAAGLVALLQARTRDALVR